MRILVLGALVGLTLLGAGASYGDEPRPVPMPVLPGPSGEELAQDLKEALAGDDEEAVVEALEAAKDSGHDAVVREARRALKAKERAVRHAAARALGRMRSAKALDALHDALQSNTQLKDDEELFALVLKEVGRHGQERSLKVLLDNPFRWLTVASGTARLLAVANIRSPQSVEGLIAAGKKVGSGGGRLGTTSDIIAALRPAFRAAMVVLTGHDEGPGAGLAWERWWKDAGKAAGVPKERPPVPAEVRQLWEGFWKQPYGTEAQKPTKGAHVRVTVVESPSAEQVAEAVAALKQAFDGKDEETIAEALQSYGGLHDKAVLHEVAQGLRSRSARVRWVTIDVLGWSRYEPALRQLHRLVARERNLPKDDEALFAHLLKAIGRHGHESSIRVLADHPFRGLTYASGQARILGLARIRSRESVEELLSAMTLVGERRRRRGGDTVVPRFLGEFRLALMVLTGEDRGPSKQAWLSWWQDAKRTFKVSEVAPSIPPAFRAIWEEYWEEPYDAAGR